jgi:hypothetical protein
MMYMMPSDGGSSEMENIDRLGAATGIENGCVLSDNG